MKFKKIKSDNFFYIVPLATDILKESKMDKEKYDSNWEVYKRCKFKTPEEFFKKMTEKYNMSYTLTQIYPYVRFYFEKEIDAEKFKIFLNKIDEKEKF